MGSLTSQDITQLFGLAIVEGALLCCKETEACRWVTREHHPKPIEDSAAEDLSPLREGIKVGLSVGNGDRCAQEHWAVCLGGAWS